MILRYNIITGTSITTVGIFRPLIDNTPCLCVPYLYRSTSNIMGTTTRIKFIIQDITIGFTPDTGEELMYGSGVISVW